MDKMQSGLLKNVSAELFEVAKLYLEKVQVEDPVDRVEGHRFLLRMLSTAINAKVNYDVDRPSFFQFVTPHFKMYLDSPDTDYQRCNISLMNQRVYKISALVPQNVVYFGLQLYGPSGRIGNRLVDYDLVSHSNTRQVVVYVAAASADLSKIQLPELGRQKDTCTAVSVMRGEIDDIVVIARQYFTNRKTEERIKWHVELVHLQIDSDEGESCLSVSTSTHEASGITNPLGNEYAHDGTYDKLDLRTVQKYSGNGLKIKEHQVARVQRQEEAMWAQRVEEARQGFEELLDNTTHAYQMIQYLPVNEAVLVGVGTRLCPTPDNRYNLVRASLKSRKMLVIRGPKRPNCRYFSVCLVNKWLESLDYLRFQIYLNHKQIHWEQDGTFEVTVSLHHLRHKNHLYADNHQELLILIRELLPEDEDPIQYTVDEVDIPDVLYQAPSRANM